MSPSWHFFAAVVSSVVGAIVDIYGKRMNPLLGANNGGSTSRYDYNVAGSGRYFRFCVESLL